MKNELQIIKKTVYEYYDISIIQINNESQKREIVLPRQICHYFAHKLTKKTLTAIGANMGGKNHATVLYSDRVIKNLLSYDQDVITDIIELNKRIKKALIIPFIKKEIIIFEGYSETTHYSKGFLKK